VKAERHVEYDYDELEVLKELTIKRDNREMHGARSPKTQLRLRSVLA
jgi:hypothetical protein